MHKSRIVVGVFLLLALAAAGALWLATPALAHDDLTHRGRITELPPGGGAGTWVVGGKTFTADGGTQFDTTEGPLEQDGCAKVKYVEQGSVNLALEIDSEPDGDCEGGGGDDPGDDDGDHGGRHNEIEVYGILLSRPISPEVLGTWEISTTTDILTFTADADTEFKEWHGELVAGICVEIEAKRATPTVAEQVESEPPYKCEGRDDDDDGHTEFRGKAYGTVSEIPDGGLGAWIIGGETYSVTAETVLQGRGEPITVGTYVKVLFRQEGGARTALKIQAKFRHDGGGGPGRGGLAYGLIEQFPADPYTGLWVVGGVEYSATQQTRFEQNDGTFEVGARVKVKYFEDAQGQLIAWKIQTTSSNGDVGDGSHFKLVGYVTGRPAEGFVGDWEIDNAPFVATPRTKFKETNGLLEVDAYVSVEYSIFNNRRVIHEIETQVAPGAGDDDNFGAIEQGGVAAAGAAGAAANVWRVGGRDYVVTASTDLDDSGGPLAVGSTALVNSYQAADGTNVATRIAGITIASRVLLPMTMR